MSTPQNINIATPEGQRLLAELAKDGSIFRVFHGCDERTGEESDDMV